MLKIVTVLSTALVLAVSGPAFASFTRTVPANVNELHNYLIRVHGKGSHANVKVNPSTSHIEVDLDAATNKGGEADVYIPLKRAKLHDAKELVEKMMVAGATIARDDVQALYDMIDPAGQ